MSEWPQERIARNPGWRRLPRPLAILTADVGIRRTSRWRVWFWVEPDDRDLDRLHAPCPSTVAPSMPVDVDALTQAELTDIPF
jgi:hypothetical protein